MRRPSASVLASGVPSGVVNWICTWPWSSTGRKPVGMRAYSAAIASTISTYSTIQRRGCRSSVPSRRW